MQAGGTRRAAIDSDTEPAGAASADLLFPGAHFRIGTFSLNNPNSTMARPTLKPSPDMRHRVLLAARAGASHDAIAAALGVARGTLEKHFAPELARAAAAAQSGMLEALYEAARRGHVGASVAYLGRRRNRQRPAKASPGRYVGEPATGPSPAVARG